VGLGVLTLLSAVLILTTLQQGKRVAALTEEVKALAQKHDDLAEQLDPSFKVQVQELGDAYSKLSDGQNKLATQMELFLKMAREPASGGGAQDVPVARLEEKLSAPSAGSNEIGAAEAPPQGQFGQLLIRRDEAAGWTALQPRGAVQGRDELLGLPLQQCSVRLGSGVSLLLCGDIEPKLGVYESRVKVHEPAADYDADLTIGRGRVVLTRTKKGAAASPEETRKRAAAALMQDSPLGLALYAGAQLYGPKMVVRVRCRGSIFDVTLPEPGSSVALQLSIIEPPVNAPQEPTLPGVLFLITHGNATVEEWKSVPHPVGPGQLESKILDDNGNLEAIWPELEDLWAGKPEKLEEEVTTALTRIRAELAGSMASPSKALEGLCKDPPTERVAGIAVLSLAALDGLAGMVRSLEDEKRPALRHAALLSLRHWLSAEPRRLEQLAALLQSDYDCKDAGVEILNGLIRGYPSARVPASLGQLVNYLSHSRLAGRQLAASLLYGRFADSFYERFPDEKKVQFDPAAEPAKREATVKKWAELVKAATPDN